MNYEKLLERAYSQLPKEIFETKRFEIPEADVFIEGKRTIIRNFKEIADILDRDPEHIMKYLLRELGTAGDFDGQRIVLQGKFTTTVINDRIKDYTKEYVLCRECKKPDTEIIKEHRIYLLKCKACGAKSPIKGL